MKYHPKSLHGYAVCSNNGTCEGDNGWKWNKTTYGKGEFYD